MSVLRSELRDLSALVFGIDGVLVRTGKFRQADLESEVTPDLVLDSVADLLSS
ncbi:MAG: HAD hydrolase-like protein [Acidobacteriota bacterium]